LEESEGAEMMFLKKEGAFSVSLGGRIKPAFPSAIGKRPLVRPAFVTQC
jgi:hypothetical protein